MAEQLPIELAGDDDAGPVVLRDKTSEGKRTTLVRRVHLSETTIAQNDTIKLGTVPKGARVMGGRITSGVTFGATATIAIGSSDSAAKYKAAATFTAVDTPTPFGKAAAIGAPLTAAEDLIATVAAAAAPTSDHYLVIEVDVILP